LPATWVAGTCNAVGIARKQIHSKSKKQKADLRMKKNKDCGKNAEPNKGIRLLLWMR